MKTVHEVSAMTGVTVRTLRHYDAIGLLKPSALTGAGYRLYDDAAIAKLQTVLFFRELGFPLKEIARILAAPQFDRQAALRDQIALLNLEKKRIDRMIALAKESVKGDGKMDFSAFNKEELRQYADEAKARWGDTDAYRESQKRGEPAKREADLLMAQFAMFGNIKDKAPDGEEAAQAVQALMDCITAHFYPCTKEILAGLGEMYVADERFRQNIDAAGGAGTAAFASAAIRAFCKK